jgi:tetratricopeptide (TPR) repeat protein
MRFRNATKIGAAIFFASNMASLWAQAPAEKPTASAAQELARKAKSRGDYKSAVESLGEVRKSALASDDKKSAAQAAIDSAQSVERWASADPSQQNRLADAVESYQNAIQLGDIDQQAYARNGLGVVLLRQGKTVESLAAFRAIDMDKVAPPTRFAYVYNYGRALEKNDDLQTAYVQYRRALQLQPRFEPAIESAFRVLRQSSPPNVKEAVGLSRQLIERGSGAFTAGQIHTLLKVWSTAPDAIELLTVLLQYYVSASVDPEQFEKFESGDLRSVAAATPAMNRPIDEIHTAYFGDFSPSFRHGPARDMFRSWAYPREHAALFSALLKKVGAYYDQREAPQKALPRFAAAWMLNPSDSEAAVYAAAIVRDHAKTLDPNGQLFNELLQTLFMQKGEAYFENDWPNILRFHVVLGTIFEREKIWGSSQDPRSAIFQWESALKAETRIRQVEKNFSPSPGIHNSLALAYEKTSRAADAWDQYVLAAQGFVESGNPDPAASALERAESLSVALGEQQLRKVEELRGKIADLKKKAV